MKREIVHLIGQVIGIDRKGVREVHTRCGRAIEQPMVEGTPARYSMIARSGNEFFCTVQEHEVSCIKCVNLITTGTIYGKPSKAASAVKRTAAHARER